MSYIQKWKDVLLPVRVLGGPDTTLREALDSCCSQAEEILIIAEESNILGYVNSASLLEQVRRGWSDTAKVQYKSDLLQVPEDNPIEFYHNVSAILGMDSRGQPAGICTIDDARNKLVQHQLEQMNRVLNGAGVGIVTTNERQDITSINETAENILGLSAAFLLGRSYKVLLSTDVPLHEVLTGRHFINVKSSLNFKDLVGNFSPLINNRAISGMVHVFFLRHQWEETIREVEFVRDLTDDLEAIYSSSNEQLLVADANGKIIRLAGTFFKQFWMADGPEDIVGLHAAQLAQAGIFRPNLIEKCVQEMNKVSGIQETRQGRKIWSVATPIYRSDRLEKVIVVSRDISEIDYFAGANEPQLAPGLELPDPAESSTDSRPLVYRSRKMENVVLQLRRVASVNSTVLLNGESGVGKEVFAHALHDFSQRRHGPFVRINCGAIPENLIESELFGYERGAFTGADQRGKPGLFEAADKGTLFLDEITELPLTAQVKLLRVLQEKEFTRVGGTKTIRVDVRIVSATNQNIKELVMDKKFREDLYYRLNVVPIRIPPLRDRVEDVPILAMHFLEQVKFTYGQARELTLEAIQVLESYHWPGNIRELQNVIERLVVTTNGPTIRKDEVLYVLYGEADAGDSGHSGHQGPIVPEIIPLKDAVAEVERQLIEMALRRYGTAIKASEVLGISQATVSRRLQRLMK